MNSVSALERPGGMTKFKDLLSINVHENTSWHRQAFRDWQEARQRLQIDKTIDAEFQKEIKEERKRGQVIIESLLHCIEYLVTHDLPLRGDHEKLSADGQGNFLGLVELIAKYNPVLKQHLEKAQTGRGRVSYLSPATQNELIFLMAAKVRSEMIKKIKASKYYCILCDSTPDTSHVDQHSVVIRHVVETSTPDGHVKAEIKETFLGFANFDGIRKDAASVEEGILAFLTANDIDFNDCRAQCYDNAAVMSGDTSGVQRRLSARNANVLYINCDNHSLNLAGKDAVAQSVESVTFFGHLEAVYLFFARSTSRWQLLHDAGCTVKRATEPRWSTKYAAVEAMRKSLSSVLNVLEDLASSSIATSDTKADATQLLNGILTFEFLCFLHFWSPVLSRVDFVQKELQRASITFVEASDSLSRLVDDLSAVRTKVVEDALRTTEELCDSWDIAVNRKRIRRKKKMDLDEHNTSLLDSRTEMKRTLIEALDRLIMEVRNRSSRLLTIDHRLGAFCRPSQLFSMNTDEQKRLCAR